MENNHSKLIIKLEDLNDRSIFINWFNQERKLIFNKLLKNTKIGEFGRKIKYDLPTLSDVKNGNNKIHKRII